MSNTVRRLFEGTPPFHRHQTEGIEKGLFLGCSALFVPARALWHVRHVSATVTRMHGTAPAVAHACHWY